MVADRDQVQNIVVNLLVNAMQALEDAARPRRIHITTLADADIGLVVTVDDNGPGIPDAIAGRIFDPFFTTKPQGVGTGIGLAISRGLAEAQDGRLSLGMSRLGGAAFELTLPLNTTGSGVTEPVASPVSSARETSTNTKTCVLIIDDEPEISNLLGDAMRRAGYDCEIAYGGREGQSMIDADPHRYDAVVCDLRMPDLDGPGLFRWITERHRHLVEKTMFVTGDALGPVAGRFLAECRRPVLEKPVTPADVVRVVGDILANNGAS